MMKRLGHLLHHLLRRVAGSYRHHDSLAHGKVGELVLPHLRQAVDAEGDEAGHHQDDDLAVVHRPFHKVTFFVLFHYDE